MACSVGANTGCPDDLGPRFRFGCIAPDCGIRGTAERPCGGLAKAPKPIQETRVDLPTIGVHTLQRVARAGLAGIAGEAGKVLVLDREAVVALADELGLFVVGVPGAGA